MKQPDALTVLLTGRSEHGFSELIKRIVASKGLEFDMIGLKPKVSPTNQRFQSTMHFKQLFLNALMETYKRAEEIRIYEDRPKHTKGFREFLAEYNRRQTAAPSRGPLAAEVVQVADVCTYLDPVIEIAEIQHMINNHNDIVAKDPSKKTLRIKKTVFFTSYTISNDDSQKLMNLAQIPAARGEPGIIYHGNNILICPRPNPPPSIIEKIGGMGSKMMWQVTDTACYQDKLWAARVRPVPADAKYHTDNPIPLVVLALKKGARPAEAAKIEQWVPLEQDQSFIFETTVGEKVTLRIETDNPQEGAYESLFANKQHQNNHNNSSKRKHPGDESDFQPRNQYGPYGGRNEGRGFHTGSGGSGGGGGGGGNRGGGRGRGNQNRGNRGGNQRGGGRGRGRGGFNNYRSLDDVGKNQQGGFNGKVSYDDSHPPLGPAQGGKRQQGNGGNRGGGGGQGRGGPQQGGAQGRPMGGQQGGGQDVGSYY